MERKGSAFVPRCMWSCDGMRRYISSPQREVMWSCCAIQHDSHACMFLLSCIQLL